MSKKFEYSKAIILVIGITLGVVIVFSMIMMAITQNLDPINWILCGLFSLADVAVAFYFWKARKENEIKLRSVYGLELTKGIVGTDTDESDSGDNDIVAG